MIKILLSVIFLLVSSSVFSKEPILITASTGAFGEAISKSLASQGYDLILAGRNQKKLDNLQNNIKAKYKINIDSVIIDFGRPETILFAKETLYGKKLSGIVLIGPRPEISKDLPCKEDWERLFLENFISPLEVIRVFNPNLQDNSSIVVISGNSSKYYMKTYPNKNVIRVAWSAEVKNLIHFFGNRKIRVNAISPGLILTQFHKDRITKKAAENNMSLDEQIDKDTSTIPLKSYGSTKDVANLVEFLLSSKSSHVNGTNISLDGGESNVY